LPEPELKALEAVVIVQGDPWWSRRGNYINLSHAEILFTGTYQRRVNDFEKNKKSFFSAIQQPTAPRCARQAKNDVGGVESGVVELV
jgi:hypothetical protein